MTVSAAAPSTRWDLSGTYDHPHWLAHVCSGLADRGFSVLRGHAVRRAAGAWEGHLDVDASGADVPDHEVDVVALAAGVRVTRDLVPLRLASVTVSRLPTGFLQLDVSAPDELGFLGRLLRRVSLLTLYPAEVSVSTRSGVVHDRFVLSGIGSTVPSDEIAVLLEQVLGGCVVST